MVLTGGPIQETFSDGVTEGRIPASRNLPHNGGSRRTVGVPSVWRFYDALMRPPIDGTIVVTGASGGIGREFAVQLARRAGCVVLVARNLERLEGLRDELVGRHPGASGGGCGR
jgi:NADPH:quinone reductase-like Zn-dependent oxidoreductase